VEGVGRRGKKVWGCIYHVVPLIFVPFVHLQSYPTFFPPYGLRSVSI